MNPRTPPNAEKVHELRRRRRSQGGMTVPLALVDVFLILWVATLMLTSSAALSRLPETNTTTEQAQTMIAATILPGGKLEIDGRETGISQLAELGEVTLEISPAPETSHHDYFQARISLQAANQSYQEVSPQP